MNIMWLWIAIVAVAMLLTGFGCRHSVVRGRRPPIWFAILGAVSATLIVLACLILADGSQVFTRRYWLENEGPPLLFPFLLMSGFGVMASLLPASAVVFFYQAKRKR